MNNIIFNTICVYAHMTGSYYDEGKGAVTKDACQAIEWYRRAAEKGHVNAILKMGICYMQGKYLVVLF